MKALYEWRMSFGNPVEVREDPQTGGKIIVGYAAVFNKLSEELWGFREKIAPGAFAGVLTNDVRGLFNHNETIVLGRSKNGTLELVEDELGLHYRIKPPKTQAANDVVELLSTGYVDGSSFGFFVDEDNWDESGDMPIRTIVKIKELIDVGPVTFPAYPDTMAASSGRSIFEARQKHQAPHEPGRSVELLRKKLSLTERTLKTLSTRRI